MQRRKKPNALHKIKSDKDDIKKIIDNLSKDWYAEERETSILFDHYDKVVHLETSFPHTARRWFQNLWGDPNVEWSTKSSTLKLTVPWEYCRAPDLILMAKHRKYSGEQAG